MPTGTNNSDDELSPVTLSLNLSWFIAFGTDDMALVIWTCYLVGVIVYNAKWQNGAMLSLNITDS